ncbi:MAG: NAD(P)H-hydrate epimerase [Desulfobacteraceae bacterium]|nr:NAD(P)H-hydrate epimerase [Desulfobacteraceae bacterium]
MEYITPEKMREIDRRTQEEFDIPVTILMENAGRAVFQNAMEMLCQEEEGKVIVVCGRGNNGGDAFVAARHLMNNGIDVSIFLVAADVKELKGEAKTNYHRAEKVAKTIGKVIEVLNEENLTSFEAKLEGISLIIDGIFGTGLAREVGEPEKSIIQLINDSQKPVLAVDIPSGLDAANGNVLGVCIKATKTVTFARPKTGFIGNEKYTGETITADISIPRTLLND